MQPFSSGFNVTLFNGIQSKIQHWLQSGEELSLKGVSPNQWSLLAGSYFSQQLFDSTHLIVCSDQDEAEEVFESLKHLRNIYFYPGHNHGIYSSIIASESALLSRWAVLQKLLLNGPIFVITPFEAIKILGPDKNFF